MHRNVPPLSLFFPSTPNTPIFYAHLKLCYLEPGQTTDHLQASSLLAPKLQALETPLGPCPFSAAGTPQPQTPPLRWAGLQLR